MNDDTQNQTPVMPDPMAPVAPVMPDPMAPVAESPVEQTVNDINMPSAPTPEVVTPQEVPAAVDAMMPSAPVVEQVGPDSVTVNDSQPEEVATTDQPVMTPPAV